LTRTALAFGFVLCFSLVAAAQTAKIPARITQPVDLENLVTLRGNTHPLARPEYDQGAAPDSQPMERILLVLQRSPEQEAALRNLLDEQQMKSSPNYHMWLTPEQVGQQFGPADADIQAVTDWLTSQGFQVSHVAAGRTVIEFSGTAGQVRQAFHTEIHNFVVNGKEHWANASDPQIPAALAPVVAGFASLNNFPRKPRVRQLGTFSRSKATGEVKPLFTYPVTCSSGKGTCYVLVVGPGDFATIYNVSPLWNASIDGTGQTIAVVEDSNINIQDAADFRTMFGLPANNPQIILDGPDPGVIPCSEGGDECEADLDVQWSGGVAKGATIDIVVAQDTDVTFGADLAALHVIDNNIASVMSSSYGECEAFLGTSANQFYNILWEQAAAQGITVLIANGDTGSAGCDDYAETGYPGAIYGLMVSGNATTPFNVAVGGTDFSVTSSNWQTYWNTTNSSPFQSSAISYIPEMTWNDSCANSGSLTECTPARITGDLEAYPGLDVDLVAGSGGPSNCANSTWTSTPEGTEITCNAGIAKPSWQTGPGVPSDGVRDTPDVSLFAGDGLVSGSFYAYCDMDLNTGTGSSTSSCDLNAPYADFQGAGGTSFAAPAFAGIMAMVNQKTGERQGNANYVLYPMAAQSGASCASNASMAATASSSSCIFYDIQSGNDSVACEADAPDCSNQSISGEGYGILVNPNNTAQPAWSTAAGYDLATGLGTVNAANLVNQWSSFAGTFTATTTKLTISPTTISHGQQVNFTVNVTPTSAAGDVSLIGGPSGGTLGVGPFTLGSGGTASGTTVMLPGGTYGVAAYYAGNGTYGSSTSSPAVQVTVAPEASKTLVQLVGLSCVSGNVVLTYGATAASYGSSFICSDVLYPGYFLRVDVTNSSGSFNANNNGGVAGVCYSSSTGYPVYQCPTGQVTVTNNGGSIIDLGAPPSNSPGTYTLNSQGYAEDQFLQLPAGSDALAANYVPHPIAPNNSYNPSQGTATISVAQAATFTSVSASQTTVNSGTPVTLTALVCTTSIGLAPSGSVGFFNSGTPITGTVTYTSLNAPSATPSCPTYASYTAALTTSFTANASVTAQYVGDTNYQGSTAPALAITISGGTQDFSIGASPSSFAIASPGSSGQTTISTTALNGFTGTISVTCTIPSTMAYSNCSLVPASLSVGGTTVLTVNTTAPSTAVRLFKRPGWFIPSAGALFVCILLLLFPGKKRRAQLAFGSLVFALLAAALVACGGSSSPPPPVGGTSPGTYTITVTGTSGSLSHSVNVVVNVQ
jgi:hypothetical protein